MTGQKEGLFCADRKTVAQSLAHDTATQMCLDAPSLSKNYKKQQKRQKNLRCHTQIRHPKAGTVMENLVKSRD